jgi:hypothetical protein
MTVAVKRERLRFPSTSLVLGALSVWALAIVVASTALALFGAFAAIAALLAVTSGTLGVRTD